MSEQDQIPLPAAGNGRDSASGQFLPGNRHGTGNPFGRRVNEIRSALMEAISGDDVRVIVRALIERAKAGDVAAIKELFDRAIGKPTQQIDANIELPAGVAPIAGASLAACIGT